MEFKHIRVYNFENALRGMRHPKESYHLIDSKFNIGKYDELNDDINDVAYNWATANKDYDDISDEELNNYRTWLFDNAIIYANEHYFDWAAIGPKDMNLAKRLIGAGTEHRKFLRQIFVSVDITAPLYWWKEFDTYKVGTTANSTSTMHKLTSKPITIDCFEIGDFNSDFEISEHYHFSDFVHCELIPVLENLRLKYLETNDKKYWKELVRWLPESWLQTRTVTMNYENILSMYFQREHHKLVEWSGNDNIEEDTFIKFVYSLPYMKEFIDTVKLSKHKSEQD